MSDTFIDLGKGFYNIRGNFRIGGLVNIGTQCSLVQLAPERFIFLDSYTLTGTIRDKVMGLTNQGKFVEAILNLHPFHTLHCEQMAKDFPTARLYGSIRHQQKLPHLTWESNTVESSPVAQRYPELKFSLSKGVYYIHPNQAIHVGSLLAFHPASQSLHVDDTFNTLPHLNLIKTIAEKIDKHPPKLLLNPLTKKALKPEPTAGNEFCDWAEDLARQWHTTRHVCAAHAGMVNFEVGEFTQVLLAQVGKMREKLTTV